jgi:DnaJ-class molecular chaperone
MGLPASLRDAFGSLVLCRRCKGRGTITIRSGAAGRPPIVVEADCKVCEGRGLVASARGWGPGYPPR